MTVWRPSPVEIRRGILALVVALYYGALCWHPGWMRLLGVDHFGVWFLDTHALLAASDAHALGMNPNVTNPLDFFHQPHVYSNWWFALHWFGLDRIDHFWLGATLGFVFLLVAILQVGVRTNRELFLSAVTLTAPSIVLGFNRGNADLFIFIILAAAVPCLLSSRAVVRWSVLAVILFATGLKFYPVLAGFILLGTDRTRREKLAQVTVFLVLLLLLAIQQWSAVERYTAAEAPSGLFTFGAGAIAQLLDVPGGTGNIVAAVIAIGSTIFWWRVAPSYSIPEERKADFLKFILGAALLTGCYLLTMNYAYRRVFAIFMTPFLWWTWGAPYLGPVWFRHVSRVTGFLLIALLWLDGFACLGINLFTNLSQAQITTLSDRWMLAQQPFVAAVRIGLLAFLVPFVRDSIRAMRFPPPSGAAAAGDST
ncbi:MAG TPA: hypothetical protein VHO24_06565 [Opitutaceae bacterium]|nr:hypothetical protein [Opitutaceae bacterium]